MLMNHKYFNFTQIPDKTNDVTFLKSPETIFLDHCLPFLVIFARWGFDPKNPALSDTTTYGPLTPCYVSEKTNEPISRKLVDRRKARWKDRQTQFYRTLPAAAGGPIITKRITSTITMIMIYTLSILLYTFLSAMMLCKKWTLTSLAVTKNVSVLRQNLTKTELRQKECLVWAKLGYASACKFKKSYGVTYSLSIGV